jgi:hypothetical protein
MAAPTGWATDRLNDERLERPTRGSDSRAQSAAGIKAFCENDAGGTGWFQGTTGAGAPPIGHQSG